MKKLMIIMLSLLELQAASAQVLGRLQAMKEPVAGRKFHIVYSTAGSLLENERYIEVSAYYYDATHKTGGEKYKLREERPYKVADIVIPVNTVLVQLVFSSVNGTIKDNNNGNGYLFPVYINGAPAPYALYQMSTLMEGIPVDGKLKKDLKQGLAYMKEELLYHPSGEEKFRQRYYNMLANSPETEDKELLIKKLLTIPETKEEDLMMAQLYFSYFGMQQAADSLDQLLLLRFPSGKYMEEKKKKQEQPPVPHSRSGGDNETPRSAQEISRARATGMVNEPVSPFTIKDLDGNEITFGEGDLKGKIIVIDFWATWCRPCIASFPAMQRVVEKYRNDPDVRFFFINTMEKGDAVQLVKDFLQKNPYPFTMLIDEKMDRLNLYKAYTKLKVEGGIPAKIVIDRKGNIRFRSAGFSGNDAALVEELSAMIEMARKY